MSSEPLPPEPTAPVEPQEQPPATGRIAAIVIACAILVLPVAYLLLHKADPTAHAANTPSAPSIAEREAAVRNNPTVDNRINLSQAYIAGNAPLSAVPVLQAVLGTDPNNQIAWNNLCVAHIMQQDYKPALDECQRAVQINPGFQLAKNNLKWAQDENDKTVQALAAMEQTPPAQRDAKFYIAEGLNFLHVGKNDEAIKAWQRALEEDPKNSLAANNIGDAYMLKQQPAIALQWFQKALAMDPSLRLAKNNIAWAQSVMAK